MIVRIKEKINVKNNYLLIAATLLMAAISYYFFLLQQQYPPCCDAISYSLLAAQMNSLGFLESQVPLRTFAYPLFLSGVAKISSVSGMSSALLVFIFQFALYIVAVVNALAFFAANIKSGITKAVILLFLCCNIYLAPYLSVTLTDSIYVSLCIIVLTNISRLLANTEIKYGLLCVTAFLTAVAIVIRPTAIWLAGPLLFYFSILIFSRSVDYLKLTSLVAIASAPLCVQIFINYSRFDVLTFFPAADLGKAQVEWGITHLKYATWMGGGAQPNYYPSAALIGVVPGASGLTVSWYFTNILDGIKLVLVKFVGAFDFDYLLPYPYFVSRDFWLPSVFSFAVMFFGIFGVVYHACTSKLVALGNRFLPGVILVSWGAITMLSALELRFTLPILIYFMLVSVLYLHELNSRRERKLMAFSVAGFLLLLPILIKVALFVRSQSTISG